MKQSSKLDKVLTQAEQFYARGETDKALEKLRSKNKLGLKDPFGLNLAGAIYLENGDYANAAKCLKKAVSLNPNYPEAHSNYGYVLANLGEFDEALKHCDKSIELRPNFVDAILNKGNALLGLGRSEQAIECYDKVLKFDPNNTQALASRGSALADLGEHAKAIAEFRKATSRQPNDAGLHFEFANSMREMGELERAKTLFEKGLSLEPENLKQRVNYANLLAQLDRHGDAIKILQDLIKIAPDVPELQLNLVELMKGADESAGTFETYAKAYALKPEDPNIALNYANRLREAGRDEEALEVLSKTLKQFPNNILLLNSSALSLSNLSRYEKALEICEKAIDLDPGDHSVYVTRGFVERTAGMILESNESYEKALSLDPENSQIHFNIADNFSHINRFEDSLKHLEKALKNLPPTDGRHLQKCQILSELSRDDELIAICQKNYSDPSDQVAAMVALGEVRDRTVQRRALSKLEHLSHRNRFSNLEDIVDAQFAKAQLLQGLGNYEGAWKEVLRANDNFYGMYSVEVQRNELEAQNFLDEAIKYDGQALTENPTNDPVSLFILGPSRSGKTSIERLIADIDGFQQGFENQILSDLIKLGRRNPTRQGRTVFADLSEDAVSAFPERYSLELKRRYGQFDVFMNTLPGLITEVGPILSIIPNCKFVFVKRNRDDLATRIFFKSYRTGNAYAFNLTTISNHIDWYYKLMGIWSEKFPDHCMTVSYEELIEDPQSVRNQILDFCEMSPSGSIRNKLFDDRGFSNAYSEKIAEVKSSLTANGLNIVDQAKTREILNKISSSKQAELISHYELEPDIAIQHNNAELFVSRKFRLVDGWRQFALLFINIENAVFPRLIYQSASHGTYRLADGILNGWYSKGPGETLISPPFSVGNYLLRSQSILRVTRTLEEITSLLNFGEDHLYYSRNKKNNELNVVSGLAKQSLTHLKTEKGEMLRNPEDIHIVSGFEPDYRNPLKEFDALTRAAGQVRVAVYPSVDRSVTFTVIRDNEEKIWIADAHHKSSELNEFGLPKSSIDFGDLVRPRWERQHYIPSQYASERTDPISGTYFSNWNYIREIPAVQAWYDQSGKVMPDSE